MPILDLQQRLREAGRIRLGDRGGRNRAPRKLSAFRLTSPDREPLDVAARLWGGTVEPWDEQAGQWEVHTEARSLPVRVPPEQFSFSQWYELWSGGGCQRRCDGRWDNIRDCACDCDPTARGKDPKGTCAPHTRLSLLLPDLPSSGIWRLDTQGFAAATELAGAIAVCSEAFARGVWLPGRLILTDRQGRDGQGRTTRFVVPALDFDARVMSAPEVSSGGWDLAPLADPGPARTVADQLAAPLEVGRRRGSAAEVLGARAPAPRTVAELGGPDETDRAVDLLERGNGARARVVSEVRRPRLGRAARDAAAADDTALPAAGGEADLEQPASPPTSSVADAAAEGRARRVAMWCRDAGVEADVLRHDLLERLTADWEGGPVRSGRDVPPGRMVELRGLIRGWAVTADAVGRALPPEEPF